ncbi:MAG: hypothetical protein J6X29_04335 [Clostridia bacterium]|nr:hypothetical protein [Clostridia bacterium]
MLNLLKSLFYTTRKEKQFFVLLIIAGALLLLEILGAVVVNEAQLLAAEGDPVIEAYLREYGYLTNGRGLFLASLSTLSTFPIIVLIFSMLIVTREFRNGAIRGKLLAGHSRTTVFFSLLVWCEIFVLLFIYAYAALILIIGSIAFGYVPAENEAQIVISTLAISLAQNMMCSAYVVFLGTWLRSTGKSVLAFIITFFALSLLSSVQVLGVLFPSFEGFFRVLDELNPISAINITASLEHTLESGLIAGLAPIVYTAGVVLIGCTVFKKKDLK